MGVEVEVQGLPKDPHLVPQEIPTYEFLPATS